MPWRACGALTYSRIPSNMHHVKREDLVSTKTISALDSFVLFYEELTTPVKRADRVRRLRVIKPV